MEILHELTTRFVKFRFADNPISISVSGLCALYCDLLLGFRESFHRVS